MPNELVRSKQASPGTAHNCTTCFLWGFGLEGFRRRQRGKRTVDSSSNCRNNEERKSSACFGPAGRAKLKRLGDALPIPMPLSVTPDGGPTQTLKSVRAPFQRCNISTLREAERLQERRNTKGSGGFSILGAFRWANRGFAFCLRHFSLTLAFKPKHRGQPVTV